MPVFECFFSSSVASFQPDYWYANEVHVARIISLLMGCACGPVRWWVRSRMREIPVPGSTPAAAIIQQTRSGDTGRGIDLLYAHLSSRAHQDGFYAVTSSYAPTMFPSMLFQIPSTVAFSFTCNFVQLSAVSYTFVGSLCSARNGSTVIDPFEKRWLGVNARSNSAFNPDPNFLQPYRHNLLTNCKQSTSCRAHMRTNSCFDNTADYPHPQNLRAKIQFVYIFVFVQSQNRLLRQHACLSWSKSTWFKSAQFSLLSDIS